MGNGMLVPETLDQAIQYSERLARSELVPKEFRGKPDDVLVAIQMGAELGLAPLQALQNISVINGRPAIWGDGMRALVMGQPDLANFKEWFDADTKTAYCLIERRLPSGVVAEFSGKFSFDDAKKAGLLGKSGPWNTYPERMAQWRAFGFCARDAYAHSLRGIKLAEELRDYPETKQPAEKVVGGDLNQRLNPEAPALPNPQDLASALLKSVDNCQSLEDIKEITAEVAKHQLDANLAAPIGQALRAKKQQLKGNANE